ncbi:MAG: hypothetical protein Q7V63_10095 [Gammaproteobacteria bacterium]|nr:hypothetical protein [Gammaproteobacteria bacterium]
MTFNEVVSARVNAFIDNPKSTYNNGAELLSWFRSSCFIYAEDSHGYFGPASRERRAVVEACLDERLKTVTDNTVIGKILYLQGSFLESEDNALLDRASTEPYCNINAMMERASLYRDGIKGPKDVNKALELVDKVLALDDGKELVEAIELKASILEEQLDEHASGIEGRALFEAERGMDFSLLRPVRSVDSYSEVIALYNKAIALQSLSAISALASIYESHGYTKEASELFALAYVKLEAKTSEENFELAIQGVANKDLPRAEVDGYYNTIMFESVKEGPCVLKARAVIFIIMYQGLEELYAAKDELCAKHVLKEQKGLLSYVLDLYIAQLTHSPKQLPLTIEPETIDFALNSIDGARLPLFQIQQIEGLCELADGKVADSYEKLLGLPIYYFADGDDVHHMIMQLLNSNPDAAVKQKLMNYLANAMLDFPANKQLDHLHKLLDRELSGKVNTGEKESLKDQKLRVEAAYKSGLSNTVAFTNVKMIGALETLNLFFPDMGVEEKALIKFMLDELRVGVPALEIFAYFIYELAKFSHIDAVVRHQLRNILSSPEPVMPDPGLSVASPTAFYAVRASVKVEADLAPIAGAGITD